MSNIISDTFFDLKEWRERFIRIVLRLAAMLGIVMIAVSFPTASTNDRILFVAMYLVLLAITILPTPYALRAYLLLAMTGIVGVNAIFAWGPWADGTIFLLATIVLASLLLDNRTDFVVLAAAIVFTITIGYFVQAGVYQLTPAAPATTFADWGVYIVDFAIIGIVLASATTMLKTAFAKITDQMKESFNTLNMERRTLEEKVQERTGELESHMFQLRAATSMARAIAETQEITGLLNKAADLIAERFEYYHVGAYILDDQRRTAYLQASSSESGKALIGQAFRIERDRRNLLSQVAEHKRTVISTDLDKGLFQRDDNFPLTRSRMAIPLIVRGSLIGIIDIHSDQPRAFSSEAAEILQTLADLTAISFDNVRLLDETRSLLTQLATGAAYQTQKTWSKFTNRQKNAYLYTPAGVRPVFSREKSAKDQDGIHVPIILQGEKIGGIRLKRKGLSTQWSERERDLVGKIANQVALALENSRLVDEAQKNALRNQMIANFSSQVRETLDVESVVRSATMELRKVFDLKEAEIMIGFTQSDPFTPERTVIP
jgi:GAF domain-containing protein